MIKYTDLEILKESHRHIKEFEKKYDNIIKASGECALNYGVNHIYPGDDFIEVEDYADFSRIIVDNTGIIFCFDIQVKEGYDHEYYKIVYVKILFDKLNDDKLIEYLKDYDNDEYTHEHGITLSVY